MSLYNIDRRPNRPLGTLAAAQKEVAEQRRWIEEHGNDLAGYIDRYGTAQAPLHGTTGGPAVYAADLDALAHRIDERDRIIRRVRQHKEVN